MPVMTNCHTIYGVREIEDTRTDILSVSDSGNWVLRLPESLRQHQPELEKLLMKVFNNLPKSPDNIALAKQMSINWCVSKCKQNGLRFEDCLNSIRH